MANSTNYHHLVAAYLENQGIRGSPTRNNPENVDESIMNTTASEFTKVGSGLSNLNESDIFSEDESFEEQYAKKDECFHVSAPPGKLGIVIDLTKYSEPYVSAMKEDSVLVDKVKVGDRILSGKRNRQAVLLIFHVAFFDLLNHRITPFQF